MKTIVPKLMIALFIQGQLLAAHPPGVWPAGAPYATSTFEIRSQGSTYFSVAVDGRYYPNPVKRFSLASVSPGTHRVEIFADIKVHGNHTQTSRIYAGDVYIEPGALVTGVVDNFGRFYIKSVKLLPAYAPEPHPYYPGPAPEYYPPPVHQMLPMSAQTFKQLISVMEDEWFESGKMVIAQQALSGNWFTVEQVLDMMGTLSFEDSRLELAKAAYVKTVDHEKYFLVNKGFWFSSSVDELNLYIAGL